MTGGIEKIHEYDAPATLHECDAVVDQLTQYDLTRDHWRKHMRLAYLGEAPHGSLRLETAHGGLHGSVGRPPVFGERDPYVTYGCCSPFPEGFHNRQLALGESLRQLHVGPKRREW
jgi:hypothetical protein